MTPEPASTGNLRRKVTGSGTTSTLRRLRSTAGAPQLGRRATLVGRALTVAAFLLLAWHFGVSWQLPAYLFFAAVGVRLALIDLAHRLLPNAIVGPALLVGLALLTAAAAADDQWASLGRALLGALVLFALYLALALISPAGMGMGDVKLAAVVGLFLAFQGWPALVAGAFAGFLIGAVASLALLAARRGGLKSSLPFGPAMIAGAVAAILAAAPAGYFLP